jgi:hypothetical protein
VTDGTVLRIVPRRSLVVSALASILVVLLPVSALLYWFAIPRGQAAYVAIAQALVICGAIAILLRHLTVDTIVTRSELRGRGTFSPMVRVPLNRIASVFIVPTYVGQSPEPVQQLLVRDADGRRLYRLHGNFWHHGDLHKAAAVLPVAATVVTEPMSIRDFYNAYPGSAHWFENRPWLSAAMVAVAIGVCIAVAVGIMRLLDMPIMG